MTPWQIIIVVGFITLLGSGWVFLMLRRQNQRGLHTISQELINKMGEGFQQHLQAASQQLVLLANEKLGAEKQVISTDLANKKEVLEKMVGQVIADLQKVENNRLQSFATLESEIKNTARIAEQLSVTTDNLRKVLSNNQLRGQFGEQIAEDLLRMSGFVKGTDYVFNTTLSDGKSRPDFTVFLPDKTQINIDAKFPYGNLQKTTETTDEEQKQQYFQLFKQDVKQKIKQVTSRDYINPDEQTVDFVILFIPNEMIFSYIYDKMNDVWVEALRQKVVLAGPFSLTAILRLIRQAHETFAYQQNTQQIIQLIKKFEEEFNKYNVEFGKIGERIGAAAKQFEQVNNTRQNQLVRTIDRIKLAEPNEKPRLE